MSYEEEGKKKTGLIVLVVLLLLAIAGGAVAFFLLRKDNGANIIATYTAKSVSVKIEATYQLQWQSSATNLKTKDGRTSIVFSNSTSNAVDSFVSPQDISLGENTKYVLFTYSFLNTLNDASVQNKNIKISLSDNSTKQNVTVKYLITTNELVGDLETKYQTMSTASETATTSAKFIGPSGKVVFQILVEWNEEAPSNYISDVSWTLEATASDSESGESGGGEGGETPLPDYSEWEINDNHTAIAYLGNSSSPVIPEDVEGLADNIFHNNNTITSITIPASVVEIGEGAFENCPYLQTVTFEERQSSESNLIIQLNAFRNCTRLNSINLPNDTTAISAGTFSGCSSLTSITLPNAVSTIGNNAFENCSSLANVNIPSALETIGNASFKNTSITSLSLPASVRAIGEGAFANDADLVDLVLLSATINISDDAFDGVGLQRVTILGEALDYVRDSFDNCPNLNEIIVKSSDGVFKFDTNNFGNLPEGMSFNGEIQFELFINNNYLSEVVMPQEITFIGDGVFRGCSALRKVSFATGSQIKTISPYAFYNCTNLTDIELPDSVEGIDIYAFAGCTSLESISFSSNLRVIDNYAFYSCASLEEVSFPNSLEVIGANTFNGCVLLEEISLPENIKSIGSDAFKSCSGITSVYFGDFANNVTITNSFASCENLQSFYFPNYNAVMKTEYGSSYDGIFSYCKDLYVGGEKTTILVLPEMNHIQDYRFYKWSYFTQIVLPEGLETIGSYSFSNCTKLQEINMPSTVNSIGYSAFDNSRVKKVVIDNLSQWINMAAYSSPLRAGADMYIGDEKLVNLTLPSVETITNALFYGCTSIKTLTVPEGVTTIDQNAFGNCTSLEEVFLPESLSVLSYSVFYGCSSLRSIQMPTQMTEIKGRVFCYCVSLEEITLPSGIDTINYETFYGCESLRHIEIPEGVTTINYGAFYNCSSLASITLPHTLTSINHTISNTQQEHVFGNCNALVEIYNKTSMNQYIISSLSSSVVNVYTNVANQGEFTNTEDGFRLYTYSTDTLVVGYDGEGGDIVIPAVATKIAGNAFYDNDTITSVTFENGSQLNTIETNAFYSCSNLVSVELPDSIQDINRYAFAYCSKMSSINLPEGLKTINYDAFSNCYSLTTITLPSSLTTLDNYAFYNSYRLVDIYKKTTLSTSYMNSSYGIPALNIYTNESDKGTFTETASGLYMYTYGSNNSCIVNYVGDNQNVIIPNSVSTILPYAFYGNQVIETVSFEEGSTLTIIPSYCFYGCTSLQEINLPESIARINAYAFCGCESLQSIEFPASLTRIEGYVFADCSSLESVTFTSSLTSIYSSPFNRCSNLKRVYVPDMSVWARMSWTYATDSPLRYGAQLIVNGQALSSTLVIPEGVTTIGCGAFYGQKQIESVYFPDSLTSVAQSAFMGCENIKSVYISSIKDWLEITFSVTDPGTTSYTDVSTWNCSSNPMYYGGQLYVGGQILTSVEVPSEITSIKAIAFYNVKTLESITLHSSVMSIGSGAFFRCESLKSIVLPDAITVLGAYTFYCCFGLKSITFPQNIQIVYRTALSNCYPTVVYFRSQSTYVRPYPNGYSTYSLRDYGVYAYYTQPTGEWEEGTLVVYRDGAKVALVDYLSEEQDVVIPNEIAVISPHAFSNKNIKTVTFDEGSALTTIGTGAFADCAYLTEFTIPSNVKTIANLAFYGCSVLSTIYNYSTLEIYPGDSSNGYVAAYAKVVYDWRTSTYETTSIEKTFVTYTLDGVVHLAHYITESTASPVMPEGIEVIDAYAFSGSRFASIVIPEGIKSIEKYAFANCPNLVEVSLPRTLESIGDYAFYSSSMLLSITIPEGVKTIGQYAFDSCSKLIEISFPSTLESVGRQAFHNCSLLEIIRVPSVASWAKICFEDQFANPAYASELRKVMVGENDIATLTEVTIPSNVEKIGDYVFYSWPIENIVFEGTPKLNYIGDHAFAYSNLKNITIPSSIRYVGSYAFGDCSLLEEVIFIDGSNLTIGNYLCYDTNVTTLTIPIRGDGKIVIDSSPDFYHSYGNTSSDFDYEHADFGQFINSKGAVSSCFRGSAPYSEGDYDSTSSWIKEIIFPSCVTKIASYALQYQSGITSISFAPNCRLAEIGNGAFTCLEYLEEIDFSNTSLTTLSKTALKKCHTLTSVILPDTLTTIKDSAFESCTSLEEISLPASLTSIGKKAFSGCTAMTDINFGETTNWSYASAEDDADWTSLSSGDLADSETAKTYLVSTYKNYYLKRTTN